MDKLVKYGIETKYGVKAEYGVDMAYPISALPLVILAIWTTCDPKRVEKWKS